MTSLAILVPRGVACTRPVIPALARQAAIGGACLLAAAAIVAEIIGTI